MSTDRFEFERGNPFDSDALVYITMGSQSDWESTMRHAAVVLNELQVPFGVGIDSAHRTPDRLHANAGDVLNTSIKVIIAGAGGAAALPGNFAAKTPLPVIGVPVQSKALGGVDSLLSIVQMPPIVGVGTMAIGRAGAINGGLYAAAILGTTNEQIQHRLMEFRQKLSEDVARAPLDEPDKRT